MRFYFPAVLIAIGIFPLAFAPAAETGGWQPLTVHCIERVVLAGYFRSAPDTDPRLLRLRAGIAALKNIETRGSGDRLMHWQGAADFLNEPMLAVEADAVIEQALPSLRPTSVDYQALRFIQHSARRNILQTLEGYQASHGRETTAHGLLTSSHAAERIGRKVLENFERIADPIVEESTRQLISQLADTDSFAVVTASVQWLRGIVAAAETIGHEKMIAASQSALIKQYLRLLSESGGTNADQAFAWLRYASGGDGAAFLADVNAMREGRSPFAIWLAIAVRGSDPQNDNRTTSSKPTHTLSLAREHEIRLGAIDGLPFPAELSSQIIRAAIDSRPIVLPDGTRTERLNRAIDVTNLKLIAALCVDPRTLGDAAMLALDHASQLIGDPRIDAESLRDWLRSLFGDRGRVSGEAYNRFLQEATTILGELRTISLAEQIVISREHAQRVDEPMGQSFDLWITHAASQKVVAAIEIKQTSRPRIASDLGGIIKQATGKLDGLLISKGAYHFQFVSPAPTQSVRYLDARKILVIQIPWDLNPTSYRKGDRVFVLQPSGVIEEQRTLPDGSLTTVRRSDLFSDIGGHLSKIKDADCFDEIRLASLSGDALVTYLKPSAPGAEWKRI